MFCHSPPPPGTSLQLTRRSERTTPRGPAWKNSFKFSEKPVPKPGMLNAFESPGRSFTGRSTRKSRKLENRLLRLDCSPEERRRPRRKTGVDFCSVVLDSRLAPISAMAIPQPSLVQLPIRRYPLQKDVWAGLADTLRKLLYHACVSHVPAARPANASST